MALPINTAAQKDFRDDLSVSGAPWGVETAIVPVKTIGRGIERNNSSQAVKTYYIEKTSVGGEDFYVQVATVQSNIRIFFLCDGGSGTYYIEDASSGNISPSDGSTVALSGDTVNSGLIFPPVPRECKRGIRVKLTVGAGGTERLLVYYLEERTDGQLESL